MTTEPPLSGRRKQASRNDDAILAAAREVFIEDPTAPIAAVATRADVGISALYRRYASKEVLLGRLCLDGMAVYIAEAERALADDGDPWSAYVEFLRRVVEQDTHSLTARLAGTFTPTAEHMERSIVLMQRGEELFDRTMAAGVLRADVTFLDVGFLLEMLSGTRLGDHERTAALRQRFLKVIIDGLRAGETQPLPGRPPSDEEQRARWIPG